MPWQTNFKRGPAAAILALASLGLSCEAEQPRPYCTISRAAYAARYELEGQPTGMCTGYTPLKGEQLGGQAYLPDPGVPGAKYSLAIQSEVLGKRKVEGERADPKVVDPDPNHKPYSHGPFTTDRPDPDTNICSAPVLGDAEMNLAELVIRKPMAMPPTTETLPAIQVKYHWSDVKSYVTAANTGLIWGGNLEHTLNGCTAKYTVVALSPPVSCAGEDMKPDAKLCEAAPRESEGFFGSGLNPDIVVECDPDLLLCVAAQPFPSLRK